MRQQERELREQMREEQRQLRNELEIEFRGLSEI
jgi:hypothetical protein